MLTLSVHLFGVRGAAAADAAAALHVAARSLDQLDALAHLDPASPRGEPVLSLRLVVADGNGDDDQAEDGQAAADTDQDVGKLFRIDQVQLFRGLTGRVDLVRVLDVLSDRELQRLVLVVFADVVLVGAFHREVVSAVAWFIVGNVLR